MASKKQLRRRIALLEAELALARPVEMPGYLPGQFGMSPITVRVSDSTWSCCVCSTGVCSPNHAHSYCSLHQGGWVIS